MRRSIGFIGAVAAAMISAPILPGLALMLAFCRETRGIDLRVLDQANAAVRS